MTYGVQPTGFVRKPLSVIQAEIEALLITEFGPDVIQTPQSPLGQLNGLMADMITELWEVAEGVYQSYDPDQAEGLPLDNLARLRLLTREDGETDGSFRRAITNSNVARIGMADLARAVQNVPGVRYRQVFVNETNEVDANSMAPHTVAVAVLGGEDDEIGAVINQYVSPGISTFGNAVINTIDEGFCRTFRIVRPIEVPVSLVVQVKTSNDRFGCPAPSPTAIGSALFAYLTETETRPWNGQDISPYLVRSFVEANFAVVEYVNLIGQREGDDDPYFSNVPIDFLEIADVTSVTIEVVD